MVFRTGANAALGQQGFKLSDVDTVAKVPIGSILKAYDPDINQCGEFIYLPGVAACTAGDAVVYDLLPTGPTSARAVNNVNNNTGRPVAVALVPVLAGQFGWFQISGPTIVNATAASAVGAMNLTATAGSVNSAADAGDQVIGARLSSAVGTPAAGKAWATLNRPAIQSQIT